MFAASYFGISYFANSYYADKQAPPPVPDPVGPSTGLLYNTGEHVLNATGAFVSAFPRTLTNLDVYNGSGATAYIQMFDQANPSSVALGTTVPDYQFIAPNGSSLLRMFGSGLNLKNGLIIYATTTVGGAVGSNAGVKSYGTVM